VPELDPERGDHWLCDVPIVAGPSHWTFVRLSLVRWQPHAINDHELSTPVVTWVQIPATRRAEVTFEHAENEMADRLVTLRMTGLGFELRMTGLGFDQEEFGPLFVTDLASLPMKPLIDVRLVRASDLDAKAPGVTAAWIPVIDPETGNPYGRP
jgi:hypothetical protein